jgi:hypothetical protein
MHNSVKRLWTGIIWLWQLPQHLLALLLIHLWGAKYSNAHGVWWIDKPGIGVSLGQYILLDKRYGSSFDVTTVIKHERGHSLQSLIFGPVYLLAIGIPSAVFANLWDRMFHKDWSSVRREHWYYSRYPEKWADRLGGVLRGW